MPKASDQYNLAVLDPGLAKEWHPTRNDDLTPRTVTPGSGKRVWWICIHGHEWEAAVYSRSRGSGCPLCSRPTPADNSETLISNTDLTREWHLTKNRGLNLRNLPAGFNKKVWWICAEGHEWQATVKSRLQGKGCPDCKTHVSRKKAGRKQIISLRPRKIAPSRGGGFAQPLFSQTSAATGFRKNKRFLHRTTVILENADSGAWSYAQTKDLSNDGMLLESEVAFKPGTKINIKFDAQPFRSAPKTYSSIVRWCRENTDDPTIHRYGIGVKFI